MRIDVHDSNVEQAIRVLKKKMNREGLFREMKKRKFYEKPSERRRRKAAESFRRMRKKVRKPLSIRGASASRAGGATNAANGRGGFTRRPGRSTNLNTITNTNTNTNTNTMEMTVEAL